MSEYTKAETTLLPNPRKITVLMRQKDLMVGENKDLRIQSFFVREGEGAPFLVQVIGDDAHIEADKSYTVMLKERTQTRVADNKVFTELQIAAAEEA